MAFFNPSGNLPIAVIAPPVTSPSPPRISENVPALLPISENAGTAPTNTPVNLPRFISSSVDIPFVFSAKPAIASVKLLSIGTLFPISLMNPTKPPDAYASFKSDIALTPTEARFFNGTSTDS